MPKFRTRFNVDDFNVTGLVCETPSMTQQQFKEECDVNSIMDKYRITGTVPTRLNAQYGDFSEVSDYLSAQNTILSAQEQFDSLPSNIRKEFDNSPAKMLEFIHNPNNRERAIEIGLIDNSSNVINSSSSIPLVVASENTVE